MKTLSKGITSLCVSILVFLSMLGSAYIIYHLEDLGFRISKYVWQGVGDVFFWILAVLESYIGFWLAFYFLPKKLGVENLKQIYFNDFPREFHRYLMAILIGIPVGLAFSGIWKLILLGLLVIF